MLQRRQPPADALRTIYHRYAQQVLHDYPQQFRRRGFLEASKRVPLRGTSRTAVVGQALRLPKVDRLLRKTMTIAEGANIKQSKAAAPANALGPTRSTLDRDAIMPGLLHSRDERFGFWKNHRLTRIRSGKFRHRIHGIEA